MILGPRLGKYTRTGSVNVLIAHNAPMYMLGTLILALAGSDSRPATVPLCRFRHLAGERRARGREYDARLGLRRDRSHALPVVALQEA